MLTTKDKILDAIIAYIKEEPSLDHVSMTQIAQRAGIGKSTVYDYFETKDALVEEAYLYLIEKYSKTLLSEIPEQTYKEALIHQLKNILTVMKDAKLIMDAIMNADKNMGLFNFKVCQTKIMSIRADMGKRFSEIFRLGYKEGNLDNLKKPYLPNVIQAIISGLMFQYVNNKMIISEEDLMNLIYEELTKIIKS